jgi:hypothetical protein
LRAQIALLNARKIGGSFSLLSARLSVNHPTLTAHKKAAKVTPLQQCFDIDFRHPKVIYPGPWFRPKEAYAGKAIFGSALGRSRALQFSKELANLHFGELVCLPAECGSTIESSKSPARSFDL